MSRPRAATSMVYRPSAWVGSEDGGTMLIDRVPIHLAMVAMLAAGVLAAAGRPVAAEGGRRRCGTDRDGAADVLLRWWDATSRHADRGRPGTDGVVAGAVAGTDVGGRYGGLRRRATRCRPPGYRHGQGLRRGTGRQDQGRRGEPGAADGEIRSVHKGPDRGGDGWRWCGGPRRAGPCGVSGAGAVDVGLR